MSGIHHASNAWKMHIGAFDGMGMPWCQRGPPACDDAEPEFEIMLGIVLSSAIAIAAGVGIVIQQMLNVNLRTSLGSAAWSGVTSYAVGLSCMAIFALATRDPVPAAENAVRLPWWAWSGGLFGAIFVGSAIFLVPQLGAATFIVLLVAGQMLASVIFDHFGWMGLAQRAIDLPRSIGVVLLIGSVILIRR